MKVNPLQKKTARIFNILNGPDMRRSRPYKPEQVHAAIQKALERDVPLQIVGFWGGHKEKGAADEYDRAAMERLERTAKAASRIHPVEIHLLFSDTHSAVINDATARQIEAYHESVGAWARELGVKLTRLSRLYASVFRGKNAGAYAKAVRLAAQGMPEADALLKENEPLAQIVRRAAQRRLQARPVGRPRKGVTAKPAPTADELGQRYAALRLKESDAIRRHFEASENPSIYFAYGHPQTQPLLPDGPTLYWYSTKKRQSAPPWFMSSK